MYRNGEYNDYVNGKYDTYDSESDEEEEFS